MATLAHASSRLDHASIRRRGRARVAMEFRADPRMLAVWRRALCRWRDGCFVRSGWTASSVHRLLCRIAPLAGTPAARTTWCAVPDGASAREACAAARATRGRGYVGGVVACATGRAVASGSRVRVAAPGRSRPKGGRVAGGLASATGRARRRSGTCADRRARGTVDGLAAMCGAVRRRMVLATGRSRRFCRSVAGHPCAGVRSGYRARRRRTGVRSRRASRCRYRARADS